jgi:hypothetical protein
MKTLNSALPLDLVNTRATCQSLCQLKGRKIFWKTKFGQSQRSQEEAEVMLRNEAKQRSLKPRDAGW